MDGSIDTLRFSLQGPRHRFHIVKDRVDACHRRRDLLRFDPRTESFTVYPLPTRVTYTRELDFDRAGRVWTSNSNMPAWQIEGQMPRVLRLDPHALPVPEGRTAAAR